MHIEAGRVVIQSDDEAQWRSIRTEGEDTAAT